MIKLAPIWNGQQFFNNDGLPLSGGKVFIYMNGSSSVKLTSWSDYEQSTPNSNPLVLDSSGRLPDPIWIDTEILYTFVLTLADGTTILQTVNGVQA